MKRILACILSLCLVGLDVSVVPLALADDSDIFGAEIQPNVLILLDTSGSMSDQIPAQPYDPAVAFTPATYAAEKVYKKSGSSWSVYKNTIAEVGSASARSALSSVGFWSGKIGGSKLTLNTGNYINYENSPSAILESKISIAKRALTNLFNNTEDVRFGLMRFTGNTCTGCGGGGIVQPIGTAISTLVTSLNAISVSGYTPTGEQMRDAGRYYAGSLGHATPIQYSCQPNFAIVISDGLQNGTLDARSQATLLKSGDFHSTFTGTQNILVHTVGFRVAEDEKDAANDVLQTAADNGGGSFYYADNGAQLEAALQDAIRQVLAATFAFATPVVPTTSATGSSKAFLAAFQSNPSRPFWRGYLKAYQRGSDGKVPTDVNGVPLDSALVWEAGAKLNTKTAAARAIYTAIGGSRADFTTTNASLTAALLGVASAADRDKIINYIRGIDVLDEDVDSDFSEERPWKLGDLFHSTPVLITPPFLPSTDASYTAFRAAQASRASIIVAGANDGALHAFRESDGEELWAFVPPAALPRLKLLTANTTDHPFLVDGSPVAADVKTGGSWKTIVIFGLRRGGTSYYALDVTTPTNPLYLWGFTDAKMGESWSDPIIGRVKMADGTEKYVAMMGGGYYTPTNNSLGKAFFVVDIATGAKLWEYSNDGSGADKQYMNFSLAANPLALDLNGDGYIDRVYIGDVGGQLWKFDLSAAATLSGSLVNNWTGKRLFSGPTQANPPAVGEYYPAQAIYAAPNAALDDSNNLWVYFGTGDRNHPNNTSTNRFYGIKDNTPMTNGAALTEANLTDVTSTSAAAPQGWYVRLGGNEKVLSGSDVFNKTVFFSSFTPTGTVACGSGGGEAKIYAIQMVNGYAAMNWTTGNPYTVGGSNATTVRGKTIGTGIPSKPIVLIDDAGVSLSTSVIAGTTSQQLPSNPAPPPAGMRRILFWREMF